ncbi:hypothetical protein MAPG_03393 [Magnaporthiopsis poae ATCC 64411]|uniref:Uncharacterized protein n=1 Tax=Magnaporthiopsis poae (strain ATCC 64411 / 73-15) TaxID=644358 RepID=A0A0C4DTW6_MAGP6|nr:hypothetical protein MAPG_03393 [Magnaporthiopsis poae ATCC 64411]
MEKRNTTTAAASATPASESRFTAYRPRVTLTDMPPEVFVMIVREVEDLRDIAQLAVALGPEAAPLIHHELFAKDVVKYLVHDDEGPGACIPAIWEDETDDELVTPSALRHGAVNGRPDICHLALDAFERVQKGRPKWRLAFYLHDLPFCFGFRAPGASLYGPDLTLFQHCLRNGYLDVIERLLTLASASGVPLHREALSAPPEPLSLALAYDRLYRDLKDYRSNLCNPVVSAIGFRRDDVLEYLIKRGVSAVSNPLPFSPLNAMLLAGRIEVFEILSLSRDFQIAIDSWKADQYNPCQNVFFDVEDELEENSLEQRDRRGHLFKLMLKRGCRIPDNPPERFIFNDNCCAISWARGGSGDDNLLHANAIAAVDVDWAGYWGCRVVDGKHQFWSRTLRLPLVLYSMHEVPRRFLDRWIKGALPHWDGTKPCKCDPPPKGQGSRVMRTREGFWEMVKTCLACELIGTFAGPSDESYTAEDDYDDWPRQTMAQTRGWIELVWNDLKKLGMVCSEEEMAGLKRSFAFEAMEQSRHDPALITTAQYVCVLRAAFEQECGKLEFHRELQLKEEDGAERFYNW